MKAFVITIESNPKSVEVADRCIESGKPHGLEISKFRAITPDDKPFEMMSKLGIKSKAFLNKLYSRPDRCASCFLSHYHLWLKSIELREDLLILEHDAIITAPVPVINEHRGVVNLGKPSYGKFKTPQKPGLQQLCSKKYFPGAHCYIVSSGGAKLLIDHARNGAMPTDIFLGIRKFPWIQEFYPWIGEVKDTFTTIQNERGCRHKHNKSKNYQII